MSTEQAVVGVHVWRTPAAGAHRNLFAVETDGGLVAIDGPLRRTDGRAAAAWLASLGKPLLAVLLTHAHPDHTFGVRAMVDDVAGGRAVPVVATAAVRDAIAATAADMIPIVAGLIGEAETERNVVVPDTVAVVGEPFVLDGVAFVPADHGEVESAADTTWTTDGLARHIFSGDLVMPRIHPSLVQGRSARYLEALRALQAQTPSDTVFLAGHGALATPAAIPRQIDYIAAYRRHVADVAAGRPALDDTAKEELVRRMLRVEPSPVLAFLISAGADAVAAELAAASEKSAERSVSAEDAPPAHRRAGRGVTVSSASVSSTAVPARRRTMDIIRIHSHGGPDVLTLEQTPTPAPAAGQVLIRVGSASVNWSDTMRRRDDVYPFDTPLPFTPGGEVAGTVEALGDGVEGPPVGTPVLALAGPDGSTGYAQYALAHAERVVPIPDGVSEEVASTVLVAGTTALLMLTGAARLQHGESVLVPGAAGGVGSYAVQLARLHGAGTVIALASTELKRKAALALGADHALDPADPDWPDRARELTGGLGVDVALEATGGPALDRTLGALAPFGRCIVYGFASRQPAALGRSATEALLYRPATNQMLMGFNVGAFFVLRPELAGPAIGELLGHLAAGRIGVPVTRTLPLRDAAEAHRLLESRATTGKLVLKPWDEHHAPVAIGA